MLFLFSVVALREGVGWHGRPGGQRHGTVAALAFPRARRSIQRLCPCATTRQSSLKTSAMDRKGNAMHERALVRFHGYMGYRGKGTEDGSKAAWREASRRGHLDIECKTSTISSLSSFSLGAPDLMREVCRRQPRLKQCPTSCCHSLVLPRLS